jgi:hypothetical protein
MTFVPIDTAALPGTVPAILDRVQESGLEGRFDLDHALSMAHDSLVNKTGAVWVDNPFDPKAVLWVFKSKGFFFKHPVCFVVLVTTMTDARGMEAARKGMEMLKVSEQWAKENGCKEVQVSAWLGNPDGPDITPLIERWGGKKQEITFVKQLTD